MLGNNSHRCTTAAAAKATILHREALLEEELSELRDAFADFAYSVSHDLNAPLRSVSCFSKLIAQKYDSNLDEKGHSYIAYILAASERMQKMIETLAHFSRLNTLPLNMASCNLQTVMYDCLLRLKSDIAQRGAWIEIEKLPTIVADRARMEILFDNIIGYVLSATPPTQTPALIVHVRHDNEQWVFALEGLNLHQSPEGEEMLSSLRRLAHEPCSNICTGLALARKIIDLHGGGLWMDEASYDSPVACFSLPDRPPGAL